MEEDAGHKLSTEVISDIFEIVITGKLQKGSNVSRFAVSVSELDSRIQYKKYLMAIQVWGILKRLQSNLS